MPDKPNDMNLQQFGAWLKEKAGARIKCGEERLDCVVCINHIETGSFVALYALRAVRGLAVYELAGYFPDADAAWTALEQKSETYAPVPVEEWVEQQYITEWQARVETWHF